MVLQICTFRDLGFVSLGCRHLFVFSTRVAAHSTTMAGSLSDPTDMHSIQRIWGFRVWGFQGFWALGS